MGETDFLSRFTASRERDDGIMFAIAVLVLANTHAAASSNINALIYS